MNPDFEAKELHNFLNDKLGILFRKITFFALI